MTVSMLISEVERSLENMRLLIVDISGMMEQASQLPRYLLDVPLTDMDTNC